MSGEHTSRVEKKRRFSSSCAPVDLAQNKQIAMKKRPRRDDNPVAARHDRSGQAGTRPESDSPSPSPCSGTLEETTIRASRRGKGSGRFALMSSADPLTMQELSEGTLTEEAIRIAAGTRHLRDVKSLTLAIDSSQTSVEGVWSVVPQLHTLILDASRLSSFRDLGVGLRHLNTLSLESSHVEDLDGIGALSGLRELRLAHNRISDVTPLACHGNLQVLGLERNRVSDMNTLEILGTLPVLYSLDLRQNPLTESLGKLLDGRGRGVVHKLIPQIRVLDGTHLSGEGEAVDAQILDEADDLIYQGASRARAAWAEEDAAAEMRSDRRWEREDDGIVHELFSSWRSGSKEEVVAEVVGNGGSQALPNRGMVHWDSDLTQGGRQALSGNPSSAIRRHKSGKDTGKRGTRHSPARVLETLDLAKVMEQSLKQRHTKLPDRVSEWRKETCSDSIPLEDPPAATLVGPASTSLRSPPLSPHRRPNVGAARRGSSESPEACYRRKAERMGLDSRETWASSAVSAAGEVDDARQCLPLAGSRVSLGRPWTTGGFGGRSVPAADPALLALSPSSAAAAGKRGVRRPRRQRPQTAVESSKRGEPQETVNNTASWQPVWESLQTARLVSPAIGTTRGEGTSTGQFASNGTDRLRSVDYRRQRRARTARTRAGRTGGENGGLDEGESASAAEAGSSGESEEADDRNQIKRRALGFSFTAVASDDHTCKPTGSTPSVGGPPSARKVSAAIDDVARTHGVAPQTKTCAGRSLRPKVRPRGAAGVVSRRSLAAMDDSSSSSSSNDDETSVRTSKPPARKGTQCSTGHRAAGDSSAGGGDSGASTTRRVSSVQASRMLGFDLRKSLAAIEEWTDNPVTTAAVRDGCGGTPRQEPTSGGQPVHFLVEHTEGTTATLAPSAWKNTAERVGGHAFRHPAAANVPEGTVSKSRRDPACSNTRLFQINGSVDDDDDDDGSEQEGVLSIAEARAALGISKGAAAGASAATRTGPSSSSGGAAIPLPGAAAGASLPTPNPSAATHARRQGPAEIGATTAEGGRTAAALGSNKREKSKRKGGEAGGRTTSSSGLAVGMSDEALEGMLRQQPRTVPELRTKENFREFFQGMGAERMDRLLRGAYKGSLPEDEVDRKVEKRLGLVSDVLAR